MVVESLLMTLLNVLELAMDNIVNELGFAKVCARWVPRQLLDFHSKPVLKLVRSLLSVTEVTKLFSAV